MLPHYISNRAWRELKDWPKVLSGQETLTPSADASFAQKMKKLNWSQRDRSKVAVG